MLKMRNNKHKTCKLQSMLENKYSGRKKSKGRESKGYIYSKKQLTTGEDPCVQKEKTIMYSSSHRTISELFYSSFQKCKSCIYTHLNIETSWQSKLKLLSGEEERMTGISVKQEEF